MCHKIITDVALQTLKGLLSLSNQLSFLLVILVLYKKGMGWAMPAYPCFAMKTPKALKRIKEVKTHRCGTQLIGHSYPY